MTTIYAAMEDELLVASGENGAWQVRTVLHGRSPRALAVDPLRPHRLWCGTSGAGPWRSDDAGETWRPVPGPLAERDVSAVAVSPSERAGEDGVVFAGTDETGPCSLFRSEDDGATWEELGQMRMLPSAPSWSFPPRPHTSHVRWITPDLVVAGRLYVCIEAGALVRTQDGGRTWSDRVPDGPIDTHTLAVHPKAPGRLYSAAGDGVWQEGRGYSESPDGGETWTRPDDGIARHYLYGLAVDPGDPGTVVISAPVSPQAAHNPRQADATVYRRSAGGLWQEVREGLPEPAGSLRALFATSADEPGVFYAGSNRGIFRSTDGGASWENLRLRWAGRYARAGVHAIVATA